MSDDQSIDARILDSWRKNAAPWTRAVRERQIESRRLCTDRAILEAVESCGPQSIIELGCGEGWLCRALTARGVAAVGIDATPELIAAAQLAGEGDFRLLTYDDVIAGKLEAHSDAVVCNFSLFGNESVERLIRSVAKLLNPGGSLLVQTLHPRSICGDLPYEDGWRDGSWDGFDKAFTDPAPWYFRTVEGWEQLFQRSGFALREVRETPHPATGELVSIVFVAGVAG